MWGTIIGCRKGDNLEFRLWIIQGYVRMYRRGICRFRVLRFLGLGFRTGCLVLSFLGFWGVVETV